MKYAMIYILGFLGSFSSIILFAHYLTKNTILWSALIPILLTLAATKLIQITDKKTS